MENRSTEPPKRLPLLPLRDVVLFPGVTLPLFVGRPKSISAIEASLEGDGMFMAVTQKRPDLVEPSGRDINRVGTIACIREHSVLPDGTIRIVVSGLFRARVRRLRGSGAFLEGVLAPHPDAEPAAEDDQLAFDVRRNVLDRFEEYVSLRDRLSDDLVEAAAKIQDPSAFSMFVAGHVASGVASRQRLLEIDAWLARLQQLGELLDADVRVLRLERRGRAPMPAPSPVPEPARPDPRRSRLADPGNEDEDEIEEIRAAIDAKSLPEVVRTKALREVTRLSRMNPMSPEATVSRTYLDWIVALPWTEHSTDRLDLEAAGACLDRDHYGLRRVKDRILEHIAVLKLSKSMRGPVLCLLGPPGVGKTSLGRSIATALDRKFVRMSLGGVRDEAEIRGHRRTYIGSMPGRIVQALRTAGTANPLILLDEIDKMGADYRGDPAAALLEVLDPEQNHTFRDHYLDVDYDLSNVMFVTTANSRAGIHPALMDRMELLTLPGYLDHEKLSIAKRYLLPRQMKRCGVTSHDLTVSDPALRAVIGQRTRESGVRNLERELASLCRKAARHRAGGESKKPLAVTPRSLERLLGAPRFTPSAVVAHDRVGVATGLAWSEVGGVILNVEVAILPGRGRLLLTGQLGDTMQESGQAALSYIRSRTQYFGLETDFNERLDVHVHVTQGAVPKDGPSAGITMALAMVSALTGTPTCADVSLTGEITLRGTILPVGGLPEKLMAARQAGIRKVLVPEDNAPHIRDLPRELVHELEVVTVRTMDEVIEHGLDGAAAPERGLRIVSAH